MILGPASDPVGVVGSDGVQRPATGGRSHQERGEMVWVCVWKVLEGNQQSDILLWFIAQYNGTRAKEGERDFPPRLRKMN